MNIKGVFMKLFFIATLALTFGCANHSNIKNQYKLYKAVESEKRDSSNKTRDVYRHPLETINFFEVKPNMVVVEVAPGGGWYTEILGPYLKKGELILTTYSDQSEKSYAARLNKKIKTLTSDTKRFGKVTYVTLETPDIVNNIAPDNSVDRVLTFRNVHNWMKDNKAKEVFAKLYKALKPGGILGVVEHRSRLKVKQDPKAINGYVREDYLIDLALSQGFEFVAKSEINANYNDNSNHPEGVWTLPPSLRLKDKNKSEYLAIGESDRMTVKFRKPEAQK